jgi:parallel beta-helix repeat protein
MSRRAVSAVIIAILLAGILTVAIKVQPVKSDYAWTETIYIRADGSISPSTAPISSVDNVTYTLTDNIGGFPTSSSALIIERDNIIVDGAGYTLQGMFALNSTGIELAGRSNVTIKNMEITTFFYGIELDSCNNNNISGNNITNNGGGVGLVSSYNNSVSGNNLTANSAEGIELFSSDDNGVSGNNIANNYAGIELVSSNNNSISGNIITANNDYGISLDSSSNNTIYQNNFMNNTSQAFSHDSTNVWDDGYPSGGNYWSDYNGTDSSSGPYQNETGSDGIGDTHYVIDANNTDRYPLMAPYGMFDAGTWNGTACSVGLISNSTVSAFQVDVAQKTLSFNVTGVEGTAGFCRVTIPNVIVQNLWQGNYTVLVDGEPWPFSNWTDTTNTYVYFNYTHSQHHTVIAPEFPSLPILPILMIMTLLAIVASRRKWSKHHHEES